MAMAVNKKYGGEHAYAIPDDAAMEKSRQDEGRAARTDTLRRRCAIHANKGGHIC